ALIYIDDILLYSPDQESHTILLERFKQIILEKAIMLSERKMQTNKEEIEFLGMTIKDGKYQPHPNIAEELKKFPDNNLSQKQVQHFLGIVNYLRDFVPKLSRLTNPLRKMLKKDPPPWSSKQTKAIQRLKEETTHLPPLQIPSEGKRILQTDASDKYWGAILFEEDNGKRRLCGYKSGRYNDVEIHYHSTFKEILAVKNRISKFQFHLIGYRFLVEMGMSSFPKMLQFKQKEVPHPQLLRWVEWFSKFAFDDIKGKNNVLADILSRPPKFLAQVHHPVEVFMFQPSSSKRKGKDKTQHPPFSLPYQPNSHPDHPPEVLSLILEKRFHREAMNMMLSYQVNVFRDFGGLFLKPLGLHPKYPFIHPIKYQFREFPEELKWMFWYLTHLLHIGIEFHIEDLQYYVTMATRQELSPEMKNFATFLKWFYPLEQWHEMIGLESLKNMKAQWI
ncbi:hypothetical protein Goarm_022877, partial [Gossypium armourianum]|nr:hypothetical protein [Gossypium armourianum]